MKKKLPKHLLEKQELERTATAAMVTNAITALESQGYNARIKDIMIVTGLSRSVFAKPHIRKILVEYSIVEPRDTLAKTVKSTYQNEKMILAEKDGYIQRLLFENEQLKHEIELLRGNIHLLTHKSMIEGTDPF